MIGKGRVPKILYQIDRVGVKSPIFDLFFARNAAAVTPEEKKFN